MNNELPKPLSGKLTDNPVCPEVIQSAKVAAANAALPKKPTGYAQ